MKEKQSFKDALFSSPGPKNIQEAFYLFIKGLCMGTADVVPGVSGGTIAFITGIYHQLLASISSFDGKLLARILKGELLEAIALVHWRFLMPLLLGICTAILSTTRLMHYLMKNHSELTWSLFFGLTLASIQILLMSNKKGWKKQDLLTLIISTTAAYFLVGLMPKTTPHHLWFIFVSAMISICAMILPGISGAFILLVLGKYQFITGHLKNPFNLEAMQVIAVFSLGAFVGLVSFSKILKWLLSCHTNLTLAALTGMMMGSLRKVWPWKEDLMVTIINGKEHVLAQRNLLPDFSNKVTLTALSLMIAGYVLIISMEKFARLKK